MASETVIFNFALTGAMADNDDVEVDEGAALEKDSRYPVAVPYCVGSFLASVSILVLTDVFVVRMWTSS